MAGEIARAAAEEGVEAFEGAQAILSVDGHARNVRLARGLTQEQFEQIATHQPLKQRSLAQWTERCFEKNLPEKVLAALEEGMVMAEGIGPMSRRIRAALDEGMALAANEAAMLARTYVQAANIGAQAAVYKQNEDVIKGYKWLATLDNRTCQNCAVGDGHVYGVHDKRPSLPLHPGCRCLWLPVTKSFRELGLDIDEFREAERPWTIRKDGAIGYGGKEIEQVGRIEGRFKDWYFSLPPVDRARTSIGVTRRMLLESGAIKWDDMMDFETGRIKTLAELGFSRVSSASGNITTNPGEFKDLVDGIKTTCAQFATNNGITDVVIEQGADHLMGTNSRGKIWINDTNYPDCGGFNPAKDLKSAWNKLTSGGALTFNEEYAVEALWHELTHNRQKPTFPGEEQTCSLRMMETVTQWVARRTYPELLAALGGKPVYQAEIMEKGYGYSRWIRNFDSLLEKLGVKDNQTALEYFQNV
ncbi:MAG: minor capsid protein, partial [Deltaproteobacteria bacterium]|nr:minor capsid protein [Deltaproteobacteria bacterium]